MINMWNKRRVTESATYPVGQIGFPVKKTHTQTHTPTHAHRPAQCSCKILSRNHLDVSRPSVKENNTRFLLLQHKTLQCYEDRAKGQRHTFLQESIDSFPLKHNLIA